ncbi:protein JINGUBANG [Selaginella moellendorffii]|uniref:protein JINGUBANG n=1 Tax=Selaginella moellendorffii TaxID=88036 RepID=UPI000D1C6292|nr:protein JINGUBANG [Selaginella moellendorffii]|eukprot:XP_024542524.1 protein JINGUBANG [Selaginella moellendorffii]
MPSSFYENDTGSESFSSSSTKFSSIPASSNTSDADRSSGRESWSLKRSLNRIHNSRTTRGAEGGGEVEDQAREQFRHASYSCLGSFRAPQGPIFSLCWAGKDLDHGLLLAGSQDSHISLWQCFHRSENEGALIHLSDFAKLGDGGCVKSLLQITHRGRALFLSAHQDNKIRVWKTVELLKINEFDSIAKNSNRSFTMKLLATLPRARDVARSCMFPARYVRVRRHKTCLWLQHTDTISSLASSHDGSLAFSSSWDRSVKVWKVSDLRCLQSFRAHDDAINALVASPEGFLYTGSADSTIRVWKKGGSDRKKNFALLGTLFHETLSKSARNGSTAVNALVLGGEFLYAGLSDSTIAVWEKSLAVVVLGDRDRDHDDPYMSCVERLRGHRGAVLCLGRAGELLCSGSADATVRIWSGGLGGHCCLGVLKGHTGPIKSLVVVAMDPREKNDDIAEEDRREGDEERAFCIYSGGLDRQIRAWKVRAF